MNIHPNEPAFPLPESDCDGLTKLELAAILIMAGLPESMRGDEAARIAVQRVKDLFTELNR